MNIAIITGGVTGERSVSISSAENIKEHIDFADVDVYLFPEDEISFFSNKNKYDFVIPVIHGTGGEDGVLQKKLDEFGIKYLFSDYFGHNISFNKQLCKLELEKYNILSPKTFKFNTVKDSDFPLIYKIVDGGSSIGVEIIKSLNDLKFLDISNNYLLEQYIPGREFTVGVISGADGKLEALSVVEILKEGLIFDESQKYSDNTENVEICPAKIEKDTEDKLKEVALSVHKLLNLKHMSRSDFILSDGGEIYFLEVNTIPGMTKKSLIIKELKVDGYDLGELLESWCR